MRPKDCSLCAKINKKASDRVVIRGKSRCGSFYEDYSGNGAEGYCESFATLDRLDDKPLVRSAMMPKNEGEAVMLAIDKEGSTSHVSPPKKSPREPRADNN